MLVRWILGIRDQGFLHISNGKGSNSLHCTLSAKWPIPLVRAPNPLSASLPQYLQDGCHSPIAPYSLLDSELLKLLVALVNQLASLDLLLRHRFLQPPFSSRKIPHVHRFRQVFDGSVQVLDLLLVARDHVVDVTAVAVDAETGCCASSVPGYTERALFAFTVRVDTVMAGGLDGMLVVAALRVLDTGAEAHDGDAVKVWAMIGGGTDEAGKLMVTPRTLDIYR